MTSNILSSLVQLREPLENRLRTAKSSNLSATSAQPQREHESGARVAREWLKYAAALLLIFTLGVGQVWGDPYHTLDFTAITANNSSYNTTYWDYGSWSVNQCANNSGNWAYVRCGVKASSSSTTATASKTSNFKGPKIESKISKIVICHKGISNSNVTNTSITITAYSKSDYTSSIWTQTRSSLGLSTGGTSDTIQFIPSSDIAKDSYYIVSITSTVKGKSNMGVDVEKVEFYAPAAPSCGVPSGPGNSSFFVCHIQTIIAVFSMPLLCLFILTMSRVVSIDFLSVDCWHCAITKTVIRRYSGLPSYIYASCHVSVFNLISSVKHKQYFPAIKSRHTG